jgi:hypothetical protein
MSLRSGASIASSFSDSANMLPSLTERRVSLPFPSESLLFIRQLTRSCTTSSACQTISFFLSSACQTFSVPLDLTLRTHVPRLVARWRGIWQTSGSEKRCFASVAMARHRCLPVVAQRARVVRPWRVLRRPWHRSVLTAEPCRQLRWLLTSWLASAKCATGDKLSELHRFFFLVARLSMDLDFWFSRIFLLFNYSDCTQRAASALYDHAQNTLF